MRASGILLPIASLPSNYGIGCFSNYAYDFIDKLKKAGQSYWQILPIGPTSFGDSPYQSFSTFAGNPYFIDLEYFINKGLLTKEECDACDFGDKDEYIDYGKIYQSRFRLLKAAYNRDDAKQNGEFKNYCIENSYWLKDYALFMAVKHHFGEVSWSEWEEDIKRRLPEAIVKYQILLKDEIEFFKYLQYIFKIQWNKLKKYANDNDIQIIGDIPIYVAFDSADTWAHPELFQFDENMIPIAVAGCPPDAFSTIGQHWGNPLYCWEYHKKYNFKWWMQRISYCFKWYDVLRVDHFKGFDEYYSIPYGETTAVNGEWKKGPGFAFFEELKMQLGDVNIIAEDLGNLTDSVRTLLKQTGYPGMKVLQFAFDSREKSDYLPHNYEKNSVVYTGTHDNDTILGWYQNINKEDRALADDYLNKYCSDKEDLHWNFIRLAQQSVSDLCIIPIQDYLGLGSKARINTPSTLGNNWNWRLKKDEITGDLLEKIYRITKLCRRI
jgi:4-alpha-glucanotransferase